MEPDTTPPRQTALPADLDEALALSDDKIAGHATSVALFDLSKTFSHIYRLLMPRLIAVQMTMGIKTDSDAPKEIHGDQFALCHTLLLILHHLIEQIQEGKLTITVSLHENSLQIAIDSVEDADLSVLVSDNTIVNQLCEHQQYKLSIRQSSDNPLVLLQIPLPQTQEAVQPCSPCFLIVEDNDVNATVLQHFLSHYSETITRVKNGQQALDFIADNPVDFVMMDINMPVMDGLEACKHIRNNAEIKQPVIIAVTADSTKNSEQACMASGMDGFLAKPYSTAQLRETLTPFMQPNQSTT